MSLTTSSSMPRPEDKDTSCLCFPWTRAAARAPAAAEPAMSPSATTSSTASFAARTQTSVSPVGPAFGFVRSSATSAYPIKTPRSRSLVSSAARRIRGVTWSKSVKVGDSFGDSAVETSFSASSSTTARRLRFAASSSSSPWRVAAAAAAKRATSTRPTADPERVSNASQHARRHASYFADSFADSSRRVGAKRVPLVGAAFPSSATRTSSTA